MLLFGVNSLKSTSDLGGYHHPFLPTHKLVHVEKHKCVPLTTIKCLFNPFRTTKITSEEFQNLLRQSYVIVRIQRLEG